MSNLNVLVVEGSEVKLRLLAERAAHKTPVHVDWLRFTALLRNAVPDFLSKSGPSLQAPETLGERSFKNIFPLSQARKSISRDLSETTSAHIVDLVRSTLDSFKAERNDPAFLYAAQQALDLAKNVAFALGVDFKVSPEVIAGKDFYKYRYVIEREGHPCGWVGFLAASNSPSAERQNQTIHVNLEGHACTFADHGWADRIASIIDDYDAKITRCDLALDFFDGLGHDFSDFTNQYHSGAFDVRGKRPSTKQLGDWFNSAERSLYIGCKKSGKETNIYEKGDQLFGREAKNPWVRVELRYGNKLRVLSSDMLRRPADFFSGASDWHCKQLQLADALAAANPQSVKVTKKLQIQSVVAEVARNLRWAAKAAAPTIAAAFRYLPESEFLELCDWRTKALPGRLRRFGVADLTAAFASKFSNGSSVGPASAFA
jgi:phage replication initiation protein